VSDKLLPCPFCNSLRVGLWTSAEWWHGHCDECGANGPLGRSSAIEKWNTRAKVEEPTPGNLLLEEEFIVSAAEYAEFLAWTEANKEKKL
jgi:hypothetical protein